ncbi:MAG: hypothetical protein IPH33_11365 [Bacteroidetes bacterium]|nr:hypothetical protein [Bacteroidota bacterium]
MNHGWGLTMLENDDLDFFIEKQIRMIQLWCFQTIIGKKLQQEMKL